MNIHEMKMQTYMRDFVCIGNDCEDNCCSGWIVHLDEDDYDRLQDARKESSFIAQNLDQAICKSSDDEKFAYLDNKQKGGCSLMREGLCSIHSEIGEKSLPKMCATFPRVVIDYPDSTELSGSLSCPEVVRACLLADEFEEIIAPQNILPPHTIISTGVGNLNSPFEQNIPLVRDFIKELLKSKTLTLSQQLFVMVYLGRQLDTFFTRATAKDPQARLQTILPRLAGGPYQTRILRNLTQADEGSEMAWQFMHQVLCICLDQKNHDRYNLMANKILDVYGIEKYGDIDLPFSNISENYFANKKLVMDRYGARINHYLSRYAQNTFYQSRMLGLNSVSNLICRFVLCFVCIRFFLFSHPGILSLVAETNGSEEERMARLDVLGVEIVQTFCKNISNNTSLLQSISQNMKEFGLAQVGQMASLLKM